MTEPERAPKQAAMPKLQISPRLVEEGRRKKRGPSLRAVLVPEAQGSHPREPLSR